MGTLPEGPSCGGRGLPTRDLRALVRDPRVLGRLLRHALCPLPALIPCLALRHVYRWRRRSGLGVTGARQAHSSAPRTHEPPHGQRAAGLSDEQQETGAHTDVPGLPPTRLFLALCRPERSPPLCPWARLQLGAAPGRCRARDLLPNSCLLLADCPPTALSIRRGGVHGRPGQRRWGSRTCLGPPPLAPTSSLLCRRPQHWPLPGTAPASPGTSEEAGGPLCGADPKPRLCALGSWTIRRGGAPTAEVWPGTLPSLGPLWAWGPLSCPCEVGGRARAGSIQGADLAHASPSAWFPDSPGSGPKPEARLPSIQLPGRRCQAPDRGCVPWWAGPRGCASSCAPQPQPCPLFLYRARDLLPQPHRPSPHPRCVHPPTHCCSELLTPLSPVLRPWLVGVALVRTRGTGDTCQI